LKRTAIVSCLCALLLALGAIVAAPASASASASATVINNPKCRPTSPAFPRPVVLIHGFFGSTAAWNPLAPMLAAQGACVFMKDYGQQPGSPIHANGIASLVNSQADLAGYINQIRSWTGSHQVDLVGHSEGGLMVIQLAKQFGSAEVHTVVGLAAATHGTTLDGLTNVLDPLGLRRLTDPVLEAGLCPACADLLVGSAYLKSHDVAPLAQRGVSYHIMAIDDDYVVTPPGIASFIREPGVENLFAQSIWPTQHFEHQTFPQNSDVSSWVISRLRAG